MRNLLGRLNARSPEELGRIAAAWQVPLSGSDKLGQVSRLYRVLTDPRAVRDAWERFAADERALVAALTLGDETALTLAELSRQLATPEADVRATATRLYHQGVVAREGDDEPLPVGEAPKLFLPRDLALLFRRVQDEQEAGDLSPTPLRALLVLLDDREIEEAAEAWGIRVIPGLRGRDELARQLLQQTAHADRLARVAGRLTDDAAAIWRRLRDEPAGRPIPLADAVAAAGLDGDDRNQAQRRREALAELEEALLVWHSYRPDGSRWLFVPADLGAPAPGRPEATDVPRPVADPAVEEAPRSPHAVAWDLLTVLRALAAPGAPRIHDLDELPRGWARRVNAALWNRGADVPPLGYLHFLVELARAEGVLVGGDPAIEEPFAVGSAVRVWRDRSFADQTGRLLASWLGCSSWIEGSAREEVDVWGAEWPGFRRKLLARLAALDTGSWYDLEQVAGWLAERDPEMLGSTFTVATARNTEVADDDLASRQAAIAEVAAVSLQTAFVWFGLVDIARVTRQPLLLRPTAAGAAQAAGRPIAEEAPAREIALDVSAEGEIRLRQPTPLRVWSLSAFADVVELGEESRYRLTEDSVARALAAGFEVVQITAFLAAQSGVPLPAALEQRLAEWSRDYRRVRVSRPIRIAPDERGQVEALERMLSDAGWVVARLGDALFVEPREIGTPSADEAALIAGLRDAGYAPLRPSVPAPASRRKAT